MIKVSVIVPVYNTSVYLQRCLDALCEQTLEDMEIILVDDGSTDGSSEILWKYEKKYPQKIKILWKENGGQATARNMGIREAGGKYIGFADSDDYVDRTLFEKMYLMAEKQNADFVECNYHCMYEMGSMSREIATRGHIRQYKDQKDMLIDPQVSPWNKLYTREMLLKEQIFFPENVIYEDTAFYIKTIPYIKNPVYLDEKLVYYCVRPDSTMTRNRNIRVGDIFIVLQHILDFYQKKGYYAEYRKELEYFCTKIVFCSSLGRIGKVQDSKLRCQLIRRSFEFVNARFPDYKKNVLFTGKTGLYIRLLGKHNAGFAALLLGAVMKG